MLEVEGVGEVGLPDVAVLVRGLVGALCAGVAIPGGKRVLVGVRHEANGEALVVRARLLQGEVEDVPAVGAGFGLDGVPVPSDVGDGGFGEVGGGIGCGQFRDGTALRPFERRVQLLAVEALEGGDAHAGIDEDVGDLRRGG